jgi:hypothetical protein
VRIALAVLAATALISGASAASAANPADKSLEAQFTCRLAHPSKSVASLAKMPTPIRAYIDEHIGPMADRGQFFNSTDVVMTPGPANRFIRGGEIGERWYLWYEHGGIAYFRNVVLFGSDPSGTPHVIAQEQGLWSDNLCALTDALFSHAH